jgi:hypothetical protein
MISSRMFTPCNRPAWSAPPCREIPCGRVYRRRSVDKPQCRASSRGKSTGQMPCRGTCPSTTSSYYPHNELRTSETLDEEETRSVEKRPCARRSCCIVTAPDKTAKVAFRLQIVFAMQPMDRAESTWLILPSADFPRTAVTVRYETDRAISRLSSHEEGGRFAVGEDT